VDNNSHAVAAYIGETNGYLVYTVWVLGPDMNISRVIVDPANGQVLSNMPVSLHQIMGLGMGLMGQGSEMKDHVIRMMR